MLWHIAWELHIALVLVGSTLFGCASTHTLGNREDGGPCSEKVVLFSLFLRGFIWKLFLFFFNLNSWFFFPMVISFYPFLLVQISCHYHWCFLLFSLPAYLPKITLAWEKNVKSALKFVAFSNQDLQTPENPSEVCTYKFIPR